VSDGNIYWEIQKITSDFDKALDDHYKHRKELAKYWDMYSGFDYGQWEKEAVGVLQKQNRHVAQFNFVRNKLNGLAGTLLKNPYDIDFVPVDGKELNATNIIKTIYYSDKEMMNWDFEYSQIVLDGLVQEGIEQMCISKQYNELGNIAFERITPGYVVYDPNWKSLNDRDLRRLWKTSFLTPIELKEKYPHAAQKIDEEIRRELLNGDDYDSDNETGAIPFHNLDTVYGTKYRVIEEHIMSKVSKKISIVVDGNGEFIEIPEGLNEEAKAYFLAAHSLPPETNISTKTVEKDVYYVRTICPELVRDSFIENKQSPIQIGRLPFFIWSSARINGRNSGMVELLSDPQMTLNKRQSLLDHMISTQAVGALMVDPDVVDNDMSKVNSLLDSINKPDGRIITAPGALASGRNYIQRVPTAQYNPEIMNQVSLMSEYIERLTPQTSTLDGQQDSSHETGILFARKEARAEIAMTVMAISLQNYNMNKGEAFMMLAKDLYSDTYREFAIVNSKGETTGTLAINEPVSKNGVQIGMLNSIKALPRFKVVVSKSSSGVTMRETNRAITAELLRIVPPTNLISRAKLMKNLMDTIDTSEREKAEYAEAAIIEEEYAKLQMISSMSQMKLMQVQTEMQMQQMMNPQPQMALPQQGQAGVEQGAQGEGQPQLSNQTAESETAQEAEASTRS
jgi:hypothetical protein